MWKHQRVDLATDLMETLKGNFYQLPGEGSLGELQMLPSYLNTLALLIRELGGKDYYLEIRMPARFQSSGEGYVKHLTAWHIALRGAIQGSLSDHELGILNTLRMNDSYNPLFQAAYHRYSDGNQEMAYGLLINESLWPKDFLPTTSNYCDEWVVQRDNPDDWKPCPGRDIQVTGAELIAITELLLKD